MKHITPTQFYIHPVHVDLIGCGGTGSLVLSGLVRLHLAMKSLGHPYGLEVTAWDPDRVSQSNIGRQLYVESEVGLFKSDCLINRCNMHFGLAWKAEARKFYTKAYYPAHSIIISCVPVYRNCGKFLPAHPCRDDAQRQAGHLCECHA